MDPYRELRQTEALFPGVIHSAQREMATALNVPVAIEHVTSGIALVLIPGNEHAWAETSTSAGIRAHFNGSAPMSAFYIGLSPVTVQQWTKVMGHDLAENGNDQHPIDHCTWDDTRIFFEACKRRSESSVKTA